MTREAFTFRQPRLAITFWLLAYALVPNPVAGQDRPTDWFHIFKLDENTYALSEPNYWQANVNYLIVGNERALLFDTGPGVHTIRDLVESLTSLPVLVIPSHFHFDHTGRINEFDEVGLIDSPSLRAQIRDGVIHLDAQQCMLRTPISFRVTQWIRDGALIDLGGRAIMVLNTPGHTPESISLIDAANKRIFVGDLVNRDITLANVPGSDVRSMVASVRRLMRLAPAGSRAYEAHAEQPMEEISLIVLFDGLHRIVSGMATAQDSCLGGVPMRRYDIGSFPVLLPSTSDARLGPLGSVTEELEWLSTDCLTKQ